MNKLTLTTLLVALAYFAPSATAGPTAYGSSIPPRSTLADVKVEIGRRCGKNLINADANVLGLVNANLGLLRRRGAYSTSPSSYENEETYGGEHGEEYEGGNTHYGGGHGQSYENNLSKVPCSTLEEYAQEYEEVSYNNGEESEEEYGGHGQEYVSAPAPQPNTYQEAPEYKAPAPAPVYEAPAPSYEEAPAPAPVYEAPAPAPVYEAPAPAPAYGAPAPEYKTSKKPDTSYQSEESYEQGPSYSAPKGEESYAKAPPAAY